MLRTIRGFGFPAPELTVEIIVGRTCLIEMGVPPVQLHLMSHIDGVTWDDVWSDREIGFLSDQTIPFIGRRSFLKNKRAAGRPKDPADIAALGEA